MKDQLIKLPETRENQEIVQKTLYLFGYRWAGGEDDTFIKEFNTPKDKYLRVSSNLKITWGDAEAIKTISIGKFIDLWFKENKTPAITIGGNEVEFKDGFIAIGCETVENETVLKIAERLKDK